MDYRAKLSVILLALLAIGLVACKGGTLNFEDKEWALESYGESGNSQAVIEGTKITATFDSAKNEVRGSAGCNSYFGDYEVDDSEFSIPVLANTESDGQSYENLQNDYPGFLDKKILVGP